MACGRLVEGGTDDFALHRALHIGNFLGALVDQEHDQNHLGVVGGNRIRQPLQQHRLAGAGWSDDQAALALADRGQQVHHPAAGGLARRLQLDALLRIKRRQIVEENLVARLLRRLEVDGLDLDQGKILFALVRRAHIAADRVAGLQIKLANLRRGDVNIVRAGQIVVVGRAQEAIAVGQDFQHAIGEDVALLFALRLKNLEDQILLAKGAGALDLQGARDSGQFSNVFFFEFRDGHVHLQQERIGWKDPERGGAPEKSMGGVQSLPPACAALEASAEILTGDCALERRLHATQSRPPPVHNLTVPCGRRSRRRGAAQQER